MPEVICCGERGTKKSSYKVNRRKRGKEGCKPECFLLSGRKSPTQECTWQSGHSQSSLVCKGKAQIDTPHRSWSLCSSCHTVIIRYEQCVLEAREIDRVFLDLEKICLSACTQISGQLALIYCMQISEAWLWFPIRGICTETWRGEWIDLGLELLIKIS